MTEVISLLSLLDRIQNGLSPVGGRLSFVTCGNI